MIYRCCDELRRSRLRGTGMNGIDYLEVSAGDLLLFFVNARHLDSVTARNIAIDGGARIRRLTALDARREPGSSNVVRVRVSQTGDFSRYTLRLVAGDGQRPPEGFDPALASAPFFFHVECAADFDCRPSPVTCAPTPSPDPDISYLAKDYGSFRRLMLDRLSVLLPQWRDRSAADVGIALVELLAYAGDSLSYFQDAIATEAYLHTARRRSSVRRHARLVDYRIHDGCNARTWVQIAVSGRAVQVPAGTPLLTKIDGQPAVISPDSDEHRRALREDPTVFETMRDAALFDSQNELTFHTWSDDRCCLPLGATRATLRDGEDDDARVLLCAGDVLIFEEAYGPQTGQAADADPVHRHAVRLTRVEPEATKVIATDTHAEVNRIPGPVRTDPVTGDAIIEIEWHPEDRLPFALCLWDVVTPTGRKPVSRVLGNIVLADHGQRVARAEALERVPTARISRRLADAGPSCEEQPVVVSHPRFRPRLRQGPLTYARPYEASASATAQLHARPADARPAISLVAAGTPWTAQPDLLDSGPRDDHFVVETDWDGSASLRFGNGRHGARAEAGTSFTADYRVGNGVAGNIGARSIAHLVMTTADVVAVSNPLAAQGGTEAESLAAIRQSAPVAFRTQKRAVTAEDYQVLCSQVPGVQRAAATFRWTGSWHTAFVSVDRTGGATVEDDFERALRSYLEPFRLAGVDLEVDNPRTVPIEIDMDVCVKPGYFRADVEAALLELFSSRMRPNGRRGVFHPDNFSFGQPVFLSPLYAAAHETPGVASVRVTRFHRLGAPDPQPLASGRLPLGRLEIARLDNDPTFPDHGIFRLTLGGGK